MNNGTDKTNNCLQALGQRRRSGRAGVEMEDTEARRISTDGVTQDTPPAGTHTLYPRPIEELRGTGHHEEEWDPASCSGPDSCDNGK